MAKLLECFRNPLLLEITFSLARIYYELDEQYSDSNFHSVLNAYSGSWTQPASFTVSTIILFYGVKETGA